MSAPDTAVLHAANHYAARLLRELGAPARIVSSLLPEHPAQTAARSGLMMLTGDAHTPPQLCPVPLASCADGALAALAAWAGGARFETLSGAQLLTERAALVGHTRNGSRSPGGSCRLLAAGDGWLALNLARDDDWSLLPAWLETDGPEDLGGDWDALAILLKSRPVAELLARGRELGLAVVASDGLTEVPAPSWFSLDAGIALTPADDAMPTRRPRVVDLSSLWAGPLCSHLLQWAGAEVIKVESTRRPDGARNGPPAFFDLLHHGKRCVALDFASAAGREQLQRLIASADIVIEASRPRALQQLGIDAAALVATRPGLSWISLTGYGRKEPQAQWIAYGDDAAVAAGLSQRMFEATGQRVIVGDAIADPLTGMHAALAAWASWCAGGSRLISLALRDVVAQCMAFGDSIEPGTMSERHRAWMAQVTPEAIRVPRARTAPGSAAVLGADTVAVLQELERTC